MQDHATNRFTSPAIAPLSHPSFSATPLPWVHRIEPPPQSRQSSTTSSTSQRVQPLKKSYFILILNLVGSSFPRTYFQSSASFNPPSSSQNPSLSSPAFGASNSTSCPTYLYPFQDSLRFTAIFSHNLSNPLTVNHVDKQQLPRHLRSTIVRRYLTTNNRRLSRLQNVQPFPLDPQDIFLIQIETIETIAARWMPTPATGSLLRRDLRPKGQLGVAAMNQQDPLNVKNGQILSTVVDLPVCFPSHFYTRVARLHSISNMFGCEY